VAGHDAERGCDRAIAPLAKGLMLAQTELRWQDLRMSRPIVLCSIALVALLAACDDTGSTVDDGPEVGSSETELNGSHACTNPWPGAPGTFNPDCVYLAGTLHEGISGLDAIVHPSQPQKVVGGFSWDLSNDARVRRTDGRLVFEDVEKLLVFKDDALGSASSVPYFGTGVLYPPNARANDDVVVTPACASLPSHIKTPSLAGVFPDDGKAIYRCYDGALFLEGSSSVFMANDRIVAPGANRTLLVRAGLRKLALHPSAGAEIPLPALPDHDIAVARFVDDHFIVALFKGPATAERWHVTLTGTTMRIGAYQLDANPMSPAVLWQQAKLDGTGALYAFTRRGIPAIDQIARYTTTSAPAIVYDEANKKVKIHISALITGG
jgi:hypothetical protein